MTEQGCWVQVKPILQPEAKQHGECHAMRAVDDWVVLPVLNTLVIPDDKSNENRHSVKDRGPVQINAFSARKSFHFKLL